MKSAEISEKQRAAFDLVIFDNDGVLVDSEPIACDVLAQVLTGFGLPTTYEDVVREFLGGSIARTRQVSEERLGRPLPHDLEDRFHQGLYERYPQELKAVEHAEFVLDRLQIPFCVASSGTHERIETSLRLVGLLDRFDGKIFSATDVEHGKPHPDLFLLAATTMGVPPEKCLVIEDSPLGIEAAGRAGMASVGYAAMQDPAKLAGATHGVTDDLRLVLGLTPERKSGADERIG